MPFTSVNPATGEEFFQCEGHRPDQVEAILRDAEEASIEWRSTPVAERCRLLEQVAQVLESRRDELARLVTLEMGKLIGEAQAEITKCAAGCRFYAEHAEEFLSDEVIGTDAHRSLVAYQPLGTVLAIMPWNFPFWQAFRCAAPALAAGNTVLLKHASNVPQCALAIERVFDDAGFPEGVFRSILIGSSRIADLIADRRVHAVSLTGSDVAGRAVAARAGKHLKKAVLELGGSDPFIVLEDADLELAAAEGVKSRFQNAGQSCIAAKRFLVVAAVADEFLARFQESVESLVPGDPLDPDTTLGPLARADLREGVHEQVTDALSHGAVAVTGGEPRDGAGAFYEPTILSGIAPGMRAWTEEVFGPVALVTMVGDEAEAIAIANASHYGLGGSVWTKDRERGERVARQLECGAAFVNAMVKSDPRVPFGGVKDSGYGRELSRHGIREFTNVKTVWIA
jgi:succinate-semialdehyde dehydrogenase / glutarate-semialdehyde dehydrogenase